MSNKSLIESGKKNLLKLFEDDDIGLNLPKEAQEKLNQMKSRVKKNTPINDESFKNVESHELFSSKELLPPTNKEGSRKVDESVNEEVTNNKVLKDSKKVDTDISKMKSSIRKKNAQKKKIDNKIKSLTKKEKQTNQLLIKAKKKKDRSKPDTTRKQLRYNSDTARVQNKRDVSFVALRMMPMRKSPRKILEYVKRNAYKENNDWFSIIDSYELSEITGKNADQNGTTIKRLKNQGWFEILKFDTRGSRLLKINPNNFGLS